MLCSLAANRKTLTGLCLAQTRPPHAIVVAAAAAAGAGAAGAGAAAAAAAAADNTTAGIAAAVVRCGLALGSPILSFGAVPNTCAPIVTPRHSSFATGDSAVRGRPLLHVSFLHPLHIIQ